MDTKRPAPRHIIIKMPKVRDKETILKAAREKQLVSYRWVSIRLSADFSKETLHARRDWQEIFEVIKRRKLQSRLFIDFRERRRKREREEDINVREKHWFVASRVCPNQIKPTAFWCAGQCSNQLRQTGQGMWSPFNFPHICICFWMS